MLKYPPNYNVQLDERLFQKEFFEILVKRGIYVLELLYSQEEGKEAHKESKVQSKYYPASSKRGFVILVHDLHRKAQ